jgi:hypothetical protein
MEIENLLGWEHTLQINNQLIKHNIVTILISIPHKLWSPLFWNITVLWSNTTQIVNTPSPTLFEMTVLWLNTTIIVITQYLCSLQQNFFFFLPVCPMVQLLSRFFVGNQYRTNFKNEASPKINNYFSDLIIKLQQLEYKYCSYFF